MQYGRKGGKLLRDYPFAKDGTRGGLFLAMVLRMQLGSVLLKSKSDVGVGNGC